jgi:hypothetical protein
VRIDTEVVHYEIIHAAVSAIADLQEILQKVKGEKEILLSEKNKSDALVRELQAQLAWSTSPPGVRSSDRSFRFQWNSNLPHIKVPPPTPPVVTR